ncbi:DNA mismatch repair protein MutT [Sphingomonas oleivorans]|uniref:DNA mismatch repair protein MutT n=2 Tax=Sphingomonas oleivorans TaxID=1735121 RepID=A0A2T5FUT3_9SPHN|nr:DNA mismatch repair protein MutT [Sphingomonas oleivorans]
MSAKAGVPSTIRIAAALLCNEHDHTLLVRKRGTTAFMQPGGKIERDEEPLAALVRELQEELGLVVHPSEPVHIGRFTAPAANEPGWTVEAEVFRIDIAEEVKPAAEIEEIAWIEPSSTIGLSLAPLTRNHVLPLHMALRNRRDL